MNSKVELCNKNETNLEYFEAGKFKNKKLK